MVHLDQRFRGERTIRLYSFSSNSLAIASSLRSFHKKFHHPPTIPGSNLGSHTVSTHRSTSAVTRQHQCALAV
jgi:hypothetical protein